jgi:glycerol uptake facilitator-like aquaporin
VETEPRVYAAELLGTFVLVFIGTTSIVASGRIAAPVLTAPPLGAALAWVIHSRVVVPAPEAPPAPVAEVLAEGGERDR